MRAENAIVKAYYQGQCPSDDLFAQGYVALRMPRVQALLIGAGVPEELLEPYKAPAELIQLIAEGPQVLDTRGEPMSGADLYAFRQKSLGLKDRNEIYKEEASLEGMMMVDDQDAQSSLPTQTADQTQEVLPPLQDDSDDDE